MRPKIKVLVAFETTWIWNIRKQIEKYLKKYKLIWLATTSLRNGDIFASDTLVRVILK